MNSKPLAERTDGGWRNLKPIRWDQPRKGGGEGGPRQIPGPAMVGFRAFTAQEDAAARAIEVVLQDIRVWLNAHEGVVEYVQVLHNIIDRVVFSVAVVIAGNRRDGVAAVVLEALNEGIDQLAAFMDGVPEDDQTGDLFFHLIDLMGTVNELKRLLSG